MGLDIRLACLRDAILENWSELEASEDAGALVVRLRDGVEIIEKREEQPERKEGAQGASLGRWLHEE